MRLIDADALIEKCKDIVLTYPDGSEYRHRCVDPSVIREQPAIDPEPHWIPCSERLPESYADVLVWFEYYRYGDYNCMFQTFGIGNYSEEFMSWMINHETGWRKLRVIAWMPLPAPYQEGKE